MSGSGRVACRLSESGQNAIPDDQESSGDPSGCLGVVGRPSQKFGSPSRMSVSGWEALPDVQERS